MDTSIGKRKKVAVLLPEEITREEILIRLPVKSLVRFQSVCKLWESYLYDPDFLKEHVARNMLQNPNNHADHLVALHSNTLRILSPCNQTFKKNNSSRVLRMHVCFLLGSVNGLVCVSKQNSFFICNPALGKIKDTYLAPSLYDKYRHDNNFVRILGFGWDHVRNDYKIVACYLSHFRRRGIVYSTSSGSWTELVIPDSVFRSDIFEEAIIALTPTTIVNNCPYWRYSNYVGLMGRNYTALVKFQVETNEFRELPEFDHESVDGKDFDFVNIKDCLAVMVYNEEEAAVSSVDVHSLDEVSGIWIKMYTMEPINVDSKSVQVLKGYIFGGEVVFNDDQGKLYCYDTATEVITSFLGCSGCFTADCFNYRPTLVLLHEMKNKAQVCKDIGFQMPSLLQHS